MLFTLLESCGDFKDAMQPPCRHLMLMRQVTVVFVILCVDNILLIINDILKSINIKVLDWNYE